MCPYYPGMIRQYRIIGLGVEAVIVVFDKCLVIALMQRCRGVQFQRLGSSQANVEDRANQNACEGTTYEE